MLKLKLKLKLDVSLAHPSIFVFAKAERRCCCGDGCEFPGVHGQVFDDVFLAAFRREEHILVIELGDVVEIRQVLFDGGCHFDLDARAELNARVRFDVRESLRVLWTSLFQVAWMDFLDGFKSLSDFVFGEV